jgi:predicted Rossmann fold nucleotide-binding protein DprA/Smf involved in DNA uptake
VERSQLPVAKVLGQLTMLEIKGYVGRLPGRRFERKITKK